MHRHRQQPELQRPQIVRRTRQLVRLPDHRNPAAERVPGLKRKMRVIADSTPATTPRVRRSGNERDPARHMDRRPDEPPAAITLAFTGTGPQGADCIRQPSSHVTQTPG
jgi:hypothetical protein